MEPKKGILSIVVRIEDEKLGTLTKKSVDLQVAGNRHVLKTKEAERIMNDIIEVLRLYLSDNVDKLEGEIQIVWFDFEKTKSGYSPKTEVKIDDFEKKWKIEGLLNELFSHTINIFLEFGNSLDIHEDTDVEGVN
jgi:hypothetical protein